MIHYYWLQYHHYHCVPTNWSSGFEYDHGKGWKVMNSKKWLCVLLKVNSVDPCRCGTSEAVVWAALGSLGHQTTSPERSRQSPGLEAQRMIEIKCVHSTPILLADGAHTVQQSGFRCDKCSLISLCIWLNTQFGLGMSAASLFLLLFFICTIVLLIVMVISICWAIVSRAVLKTRNVT